jgi:hypothetical protein
MFSYFGSKSKIVNLYPAPKYDLIIEPSATREPYPHCGYMRVGGTIEACLASQFNSHKLNITASR